MSPLVTPSLGPELEPHLSAFQRVESVVAQLFLSHYSSHIHSLHGLLSLYIKSCSSLLNKGLPKGSPYQPEIPTAQVLNQNTEPILDFPFSTTDQPDDPEHLSCFVFKPIHTLAISSYSLQRYNSDANTNIFLVAAGAQCTCFIPMQFTLNREVEVTSLTFTSDRFTPRLKTDQFYTSCCFFHDCHG